MQNKLSFNQSSVSLEIIGLPDYSINENKDQISIISQWKLIKNESPIYESKLIDIKAENLHFHNVVLKSSKPNTKPLILKIGNSSLSDIINCFDQLNDSSKVRIKKTLVSNYIPKKGRFRLNNKLKFLNFIIPPFVAICSLIVFSFSFIYFYNPVEDKEKNELINTK